MYTSDTPPARKRLIKCLVFKSVIDLLFVGYFAIGFYLDAFNPGLRGTLDEAGAQGVAGWVLDKSNPGERVEVQLYVDGRFVESRRADFARADLVAAGVAEDARHGFYFYLPPLEEGRHEARVYAVHESDGGARRTLRQLGEAFEFALDATPAEPLYRGWLDEATPVSVRGWVASRADVGARVEVELHIDGRASGRRLADEPRPDLAAAGVPGDGRHGFFFFTPPLLPGEHEARAYVVHAGGEGAAPTLRLVGRPVRFNVP